MNYKRHIGRYTVTVTCSPEFEAQARGLLGVIAALNQRGPAIRAGTTIRFGWSLLKLQGSEADLVVHEPDFAGDPLHKWKPRLDQTLSVIVQQVELLQALGVEAADCGYRDRVLVMKGILETEHIYLERREPDDDQDSGWYIGELLGDDRPPDEDELEFIPVYQIFQQRPALMQVLSMPVGTLAIFHGQDLGEIFSQEGRRIWPKPAEDRLRSLGV